MGENKIFVTSGIALNNVKNNWQSVCKEYLNCELLDLTEEKIVIAAMYKQ